MIKRSTWILLFILAFVVCAFIYLQHRSAIPSEATPTALMSNYLFPKLDGTLTSFRLDDAQNHVIMLVRTPDGSWTLSLPISGLADQVKAGDIETQVNALEIVDVLTTIPALDAIGLNNPAHTIELSFQNGIKHVLEIGDLAPTGSGYYIRLDGGKVFIISTSAVDALLDLLKNPPYAATGTPVPLVEPTSIPDFEMTLTPETISTPKP